MKIIYSRVEIGLFSKKSSIKVLLYELDSLLQYYPSIESPDSSNLSGQTHFILPYSQHNTSSNKKQIYYDIFVPDYIFFNKVKKLNGLIFIFRPEIHIDTIQWHLQNIAELFRLYRNYFTSFKYFYVLIPQISTISHFQVLQKLSSCSDDFQNIYRHSSNLLLFVKFIDIQTHPWPVILKDIYWLTHFDGNIQAKNNQFFRLLETIESFSYNTTVKILSEPLMNHINVSTIIMPNSTLKTSNIIRESKYFCFGCRRRLTNMYYKCKLCGIVLCNACTIILESQLSSQRMCPGNIYTIANFHNFER